MADPPNKDISSSNFSIEERRALVNFFELLIEADKDLMKTNESRNHGNTDNPD